MIQMLTWKVLGAGNETWDSLFQWESFKLLIILLVLLLVVVIVVLFVLTGIALPGLFRLHGLGYTVVKDLSLIIYLGTT